MGNVTTIQAGCPQRSGSRMTRGESIENLYGLDRIGVRGEVTVSTERVKHGQLRTSYKGKGPVAHKVKRSFDSRSVKSTEG